MHAFIGTPVFKCSILPKFAGNVDLRNAQSR